MNWSGSGWLLCMLLHLQMFRIPELQYGSIFCYVYMERYLNGIKCCVSVLFPCLKYALLVILTLKTYSVY